MTTSTADSFVEKLEEHRRLMAMKPRDDDEATALVRRMIAIEDSFGDDPPRTREGVIAGLHFVAEHAPAYEIDADLIVTLMDAAIEWIEGGAAKERRISVTNLNLAIENPKSIG